MSLIYNDIKEIIEEKLGVMQLCNFQIGTYNADGSISSDIGVDPYPPEAVIVPEHIRQGVVDHTGFTHVRPLSAGDVVIFIVDHGGQKLLVVGRP